MTQLITTYAGVERSIREIAETTHDPVVSFDVFDTLVRRRCTRAAVHDRVTAETIRRLALVGLRSAAELLAARRLTEQWLCTQAERAGHDGEFHIDDVFEPLLVRAVGDGLSPAERRALAAELVEFEVACELRACVPIPGMVATVRNLVQSGLRVVFVSDMYLGTSNVQRILDSCGFGGLFSAGYTSADLKRYKATGSAFAHVLDVEGLQVSRLIHVGDHELADVESPNRMGIHTVRIVDPSLDTARMTEATDHPTGVIGAALAIDTWTSVRAGSGVGSSDPGPSHEYGRTIIGPIFSAFVHRVREAAIGDQVDALYFLSRDGYLPMRIYETSAAKYGARPTPPGHYLVMSRLPTVRAIMIDGLSLKALMSSRNQLVPDRRTVVNTLTTLGISGALVREICDEHRVSPEAPFDDVLLQHPAMLSVLNDQRLLAAARESGRASHGLLTSYLRQEGFFEHDRVGLVDIGWGGTIQDQLFDALQYVDDAPDLFGYYFGGNRSMFDRRTARNRMSPIVSSTLSEAGGMYLGNTATFAAIGLIEEAARAPHGTCTSYRMNDGTVEPVLKSDEDRPAESAGESGLARLQAGAIDYACDFFDAVDFVSAPVATTTALAHHALQRMVYFPTPQELTFWRSLTHTNDIGGLFEITEALLPPEEPSSFRRKNWKSKTRSSMWTHGAVRYLLGRAGSVAYLPAWSMSYARNVQGHLNASATAGDVEFDQPKVARRRSIRPTRHDGSSPSTAIYERAIERSRALLDEEPDPIDGHYAEALLSPTTSVGVALALAVTRRAPKRMTGGVRVINDGLPAGRLLRRYIAHRWASPLLRVSKRSDRASTFAAKVARRVLRY